MTEILKRPTETEVNVPEIQPVSALRSAIDARLAEIHTIPRRQQELMLQALTIGYSATQAEIRYNEV